MAPRVLALRVLPKAGECSKGAAVPRIPDPAEALAHPEAVGMAPRVLALRVLPKAGECSRGAAVPRIPDPAEALAHPEAGE